MRTALPLLLAASAFAANAEKTQVDKIFASFNTHTPGCAVGVAKDGRTVFAAGYGMADLERRVPVSHDTIFESGSVAKQFTAAAVLLLAKEGKLSLDEPMRKYLPELRDYGSVVTIRQVLSHISGLREWRPLAAYSGIPEGTKVFSNEDLLELAALQRGLNFDPGSRYSYSNTGFNLLPILAGRVLGGETFQRYTERAMFAPLEMRETRWRDDFRAVVPRRALAYGTRGGEWVQQTPIENIFGAGGLLTTVGDLLKWNENFAHANVGGREFVEAQQIPATLTGGKTIGYAAGLMVGERDGLREVAHSGATGGYRTWLGRYPEKAVSVAVLCNSAQANPTELGRETARIWTKVPRAGVAKGAFFADPEKTKALTGMYRNSQDHGATNVVWRDGALHLEPGGELVPAAPGRFVAPSGSRFVFESDRRFRLAAPTGDVWFEKVEPAAPTLADLAALAGEYRSAETRSPVFVAADGGGLTLRVGGAKPAVLKPTYKDAFSLPGGDTVRFLRDSSGRAVSLSVSDARVWDLRFERAK